MASKDANLVYHRHTHHHYRYQGDDDVMHNGRVTYAFTIAVTAAFVILLAIGIYYVSGLATPDALALGFGVAGIATVFFQRTSGKLEGVRGRILEKHRLMYNGTFKHTESADQELEDDEDEYDDEKSKIVAFMGVALGGNAAFWVAFIGYIDQTDGDGDERRAWVVALLAVGVILTFIILIVKWYRHWEIAFGSEIIEGPAETVVLRDIRDARRVYRRARPTWDRGRKPTAFASKAYW